MKLQALYSFIIFQAFLQNITQPKANQKFQIFQCHLLNTLYVCLFIKRFLPTTADHTPASFTFVVRYVKISPSPILSTLAIVCFSNSCSNIGFCKGALLFRIHFRANFRSKSDLRTIFFFLSENIHHLS